MDTILVEKRFNNEVLFLAVGRGSKTPKTSMFGIIIYKA